MESADRTPPRRFGSHRESRTSAGGDRPSARAAPLHLCPLPTSHPLRRSSREQDPVLDLVCADIIGARDRSSTATRVAQRRAGRAGGRMIRESCDGRELFHAVFSSARTCGRSRRQEYGQVLNSGAPTRSRTSNRPLRRRVLCPVELWRRALRGLGRPCREACGEEGSGVAAPGEMSCHQE